VTSVQDFNAAIQDPDYKGPQFVASIANGFMSMFHFVVLFFVFNDRVAVLWVAYGFYGVAILVTLYKLAIYAERCFWST